MTLTPEQAAQWFDNTTVLQKFKANRSIVTTIKEQTSQLPEQASLPQRLFHIINGIHDVPLCKTCTTAVSWDRRYRKYKTFCGNPKCYKSDPDVIKRMLASRTEEGTRRSVDKRRATNISKYGTTNFLASDAGKAAIAEYKATTTNTIFGTREFNDEHRSKRDSAMLDKYGCLNASHRHLSTDAIQHMNDRDWVADKVSAGMTLTSIATELGLTSCTMLSRRVAEWGITLPNRPGRSTGEEDIAGVLETLGERCVRNDRTLIKPYELDIVIHDKKLAIEYCGLYWHSEQSGKGRSYHKHKLDLCKAQGYRLLTIFADEWNYRRDIVVAKLKSVLGRDDRPVVFARNTTVTKMCRDAATKFLDMYHIQGSGRGAAYGLVDESGVKACAVFINRGGGVYELSRYATDARVVGGLGKIVNHFKRDTPDWQQIVSFADMRWSDGGMYEATGWRLDSTLPPDYSYSTDTQHRYHKFNFRHSALPRKLKTYDATLSEWENCKRNNIYRLWDCGKLRYVMNNT